MTSARIATWNLERKRPTSRTGAKAIEYLRALDADIVVLTEGRISYPVDEGHLVWSESWGSEDERKVVMWSKQPWHNVRTEVIEGLPSGRLVFATTDTPIGHVAVYGVCIPWHMANVQYGDRNRKPWDDHITYCELLRAHLQNRRSSAPLVIAGDFNQRLSQPLARGRAHRDAIADLLGPLGLPTAGVAPGWDREEHDHIATAYLETRRVQGWPNVIDGVRCSDHAGVFVDVRASDRLRSSDGHG